MAKPEWPAEGQRHVIGQRISRLDGAAKTTGTAKYSYDINRPGMLWARLVTSPHAHAEVVNVDFSEAERLPGVRAVWRNEKLPNNQVLYAGAIVAAVAATSEEVAQEAAERVKVEYRPLDHLVNDRDPSHASGRESRRETGNVDDALSQADVKVEGEYGIPTITHCCLESHGQVIERRNDEIHVWPSTQNVSGYAGVQWDEEADVQQNKIHVDCQYMGGGFGSKFNPDEWGSIAAILARKSGRPVKLMLERDTELMIAGNRPSAFARIKVAAKQDGTVTGVDTEVWGTSGMGGFNAPPVPYVFNIPNTRIVGKTIRTNRGSQRAWRAPNHPQGCFLTMCAFEDAAAALKMDALDFFLKNLELTARPDGPNWPDAYREQLRIASDLIGYRQKAHLRGDPTPGPVKRGLGISLHTWGGRGHPSECDLTINPDASVEARIGTQDLGTGARTVIAIVVAETLGIPLDQIQVQVGRNEFPRSGASGGSTTVGGISTSSRLAATDALNALLEVVSPRLGTQPGQLEAREGFIRQIDRPDNRVSWKDACAMLRANSITKRGVCTPNDAQSAGMINAGVGGAQIADVSVDVETGVVTLNELVAVQDCGLIIDLKTAESQVYGGMIMGITYALYEEAVYDQQTGRMLNADMEFYRLAGIKDVGKLTVHMMRGPGYEDRGVIGLGEPPVISPGAAIANAAANACGVRIPELPLTPDRVINALKKGSARA